MRIPAIIDWRNSEECYADAVNTSNRNQHLTTATRLMSRQPPRRPHPRRVKLTSFCALIFSCTVFSCTVFFCTVLPASAANWTARAQPARLVNGAPILFQVKAPASLESLTGTWLGHQVPFSFDAATKTWFALAGISLETAPGIYTLDLTGERPASKSALPKLAFSSKFTVFRGKYPKTEVKLTVEGKFTEPSPEQQQQIAEGVKIKEDYLNRVTPDREWDGKFTAPADGAISDVFGSQRIFNGKAQRPHLGLDFRVPSGTPVAAMNSGTVLLARFLYFEGNCVVIDHGQGLLTLYFHLSEFKVKEGDTVKRGQEIGLSGGTGRATGPHLHVTVRWQGVSLDPARLLELPLP
jgi:murein DD-endopeptidase MepM/ murein hydrolase activator NlpD